MKKQKKGITQLQFVIKRIPAWGIVTSGDSPCMQLKHNNSTFEGITFDKKHAQTIAREWREATDDIFKAVPVTIIYPSPKKKVK